MRDPEGSLELRGVDLIRRIHADTASLAFLRSAVAQQLVQDGKLIPFVEISASEFRIQRVAFVSSPFEWCDAQLKSAAELTLDISSSIHDQGYELKDASAWNIIFDGCKPVFCDHLSFQPIRSRQWWAFGQFLRHFVFPLQISTTTGLKAATLFRLSRDGLQVQDVSRILGLRRFFTRLWPLLFMGNNQTTQAPKPAATEPVLRGFHQNLYSYCAWALAPHARSRKAGSIWIDYTSTRSHYKQDAQSAKQRLVSDWLDSTKPQRLIDVGANTGEFTMLAAAKGISVVAIEQDHECVTQIFKQASGNKLVHPVLSNLGDLCGGAGWLGTEHSSLIDRLKNHADMVLMLAVIHHLAISESIPLDLIADLAADTTKQYAIVEFIGESDPLLGRLAAQRNRSPSEFSMALQESAFQRRFDYIAQQDLEGGRRLVLMRKKNSA